MMQWKRNTSWGFNAGSWTLLTGVLVTATSTVCIGQEAEPGVRRDGERPAANVPVHKDILGDPLPEGALARFGTTRLRHPNSITSVMYARDGKTVFSAGSDRTIRVWDVATGKELAPFQGECFPHLPCELSPDGKLIAGTGHDSRTRANSILLWDVAKRSPLDPIPVEGKAGVAVLTFSPNSKLVAAWCSDAKVRIWDLDTRREFRQLLGAPRRAWGMSFSPDGKRLVSCGNNVGFTSEAPPLVLWDVASGERLWEVQGPRGLASVTFLPDGKTVAAGAVNPGSVTLYDAATGGQKADLRQGGSRLAVSPDGKILAIVCTPTAGEAPGGYDDSCAICLWDLAAGRALRTLVGPPDPIYGLAFSPDGKILASGGRGVEPPFNGLIVLWDVATGKQLHPHPGHERAVLDVAFAPDGKTVASRGDEQTVRLWDPATGKERRTIRTASGLRRVPLESDQENFPGLSYSPDGRVIAAPFAWGKSVGLWEAESGRQLLEFKGHNTIVNCVAFAPDGKSVASGDMDAVVRVFDSTTGAERHCLDLQPPGKCLRFKIYSLAFSADSQTLAVGSSGVTIHLWDLKTGTRSPTEFKALPLGMAFCEGGRVLAAGQLHSDEGPVIRLLDVRTGAVLHTLKGHVKDIPGKQDLILAVSPDGQLLASGSTDRTVRVWELATRQEVVRFEGHRAGVQAVAFAPEGKRVVSGGRDTTAIVWDLLAPTSEGRPPPAGTPGGRELERLWDDLSAPEARRAHAAAARLARSPNEALQLLGEHLRPLREVQPSVTQAIKDLDHADFKVREAASLALRRIDRGLRPELERALVKPPSAEVRRRLEEVLEEIGSTPVPSDVLRQKRAVRVLEWLGTEEAQRLLEVLAKGRVTADQTLDARGALERLKRQSTQH